MLNIGELILKVKADTSPLASIGKTAVAGLSAATAAVGTLVTKSVQAYSEYEQLAGGVDKLFGEEGSKKIADYASKAYQTVQLSASEYMELSTQFGASMINALEGDTDKAAAQVDKAITQMRDNASVMGTDIEMLETAYKGFARGSYIALDNLKLGFSGSKEGMEQLIAKAEELSGVKFNIDSYSDIVDAIQVVQDSMNISGNAAKEAQKTIEGSINGMKSAWTNLITGFSDDSQDLGPLIDGVVNQALVVADNIIPVVERALSSVSDALPKFIEKVTAELPSFLDKILPSLLQGAQTLIETIGQQLPTLINTLVTTAVPYVASTATTLVDALVNTLIESTPALLDGALALVTSLADYAVQNLPLLASAAIEMVTQISTYLVDNLDILIDTALTLVQSLADGLATNLPVLVDAAIDLMLGLANGLIENLPLIVEKAPEILSSLAQALVDGVGTIIERLPEIVTAIWNALVEELKILKKLPEIIGTSLKEGFTNSSFSGEIGNFFSNVGTNVSSFFSDTKDKISTGVSEMGTYVDELPEKISEDLGFAAGYVSEKVPQLVNTAKTWFSQLPSNIKNTLDQFKTNVQSFIDETIAKITTFAKNFANKVVDEVKQLPSKVLTFLKEIPQKVLSIGSDLLNAGRSIINSLLEGIKQAWSSVTSWVSDSLSKLISSFSSGFSAGAKKATGHRSGIAYVPYDGYLAELHKGERVLTAQANQASQTTNTTYNPVFNITVPNNPNAIDTALKLKQLSNRDLYKFRRELA